MSEIPEDIRHTAIRAVRDLGWATTVSDEIVIIGQAILAERERCAAGLEQKAELMRGSPTGDMMARIFKAEAIAIRNALSLPTSSPVADTAGAVPPTVPAGPIKGAA